MPKNNESLDIRVQLIEYRGIRGGERVEGQKQPIKTPLRVRRPLRNKDTHKFDIDVEIMRAACRRAKIDEDRWASDLSAVPVLLTTNNIVAESQNFGIVYVERALYTAGGRLCGCAMRDELASQEAAVADYARNKAVNWYPESKKVACDETCPMCGRYDKPTDCKWRAIVTVQLADSPVFPSPTRYRTTSKYTIRAILTSLRFIAEVTGGVLTGIPLWLVQSYLDVKDAQDKFRRIPVVHFEFKGTLQELRHHAAIEIASRQTMLSGLVAVEPLALLAAQDVDLLEDDDSDEESVPKLIEAGKQDLIALSSDVALLYKRLGFTPARRCLLEDEHKGDLEAILAELRRLANDQPVSGEPSEEASEETPAVDDDFDGLF